MSETLLLEVQASRAVERGALRSGREDRGPGRESSLHVEMKEKSRNGITKRMNGK